MMSGTLAKKGLGALQDMGSPMSLVVEYSGSPPWYTMYQSWCGAK